jgi:hypothetical protein
LVPGANFGGAEPLCCTLVCSVRCLLLTLFRKDVARRLGAGNSPSVCLMVVASFDAYMLR